MADVTSVGKGPCDLARIVDPRGRGAQRARNMDRRKAGVGTPEKAVVARSILERSHDRSEEHTSELQSQSNLVCRLLLEKKKKTKKEHAKTRSNQAEDAL